MLGDNMKRFRLLHRCGLKPLGAFNRVKPFIFQQRQNHSKPDILKAFTDLMPDDDVQGLNTEEGKRFEEWIGQLAIDSDYESLYSLFEIEHDSLNLSVEPKRDIDLVMHGGIQEWSKFKDAAEIVIEQRPPDPQKRHFLVGQMKLTTGALMTGQKQTQKLEECGKKLAHARGFELVPVAIVNGGTEKFRQWQNSQTGQKWLEKYPNVNVVHYPYNSFDFLLEKLLENQAQIAQNSKLLTHLYSKLMQQQGETEKPM